MYRYRRREWDESRGVAYVPARVLTDPEFTATDVAVLVGRTSWSDYQGRINPGGSLRTVARRARVNVASVSRTYAKLRERGLLVGDRLLVEQLLPPSPHARSHSRQDLAAATNRARRRCSRPPHQSQRDTYATPNSVSLRRPKEPFRNSPMPGALWSAAQKRRKRRGYRPRSLRPVRVFVPEWGELEALASAPGWVGPTVEEVAARRPTVRVGCGHRCHPRSRVATAPSQEQHLVGSQQTQGPQPDHRPLLHRAMPRTGTAQRRMRTGRPTPPHRPPSRRPRLPPPSHRRVRPTTRGFST